MIAKQDAKHVLSVGENYTFRYVPSMMSKTVQLYSEETNPVTGEVNKVWEKNYRVERIPDPEIVRRIGDKGAIEIYSRGELSDGYEYECPFIEVSSVEFFSESGKRKSNGIVYKPFNK